MPTGVTEGVLCGMRVTGQVSVMLRSEFSLKKYATHSLMLGETMPAWCDFSGVLWL